MKNRIGLLFIILLSIQRHSFCQNVDDNTLHEISKFGKLLYEYDMACYMATDSLRATNPDISLMGLFIAENGKDSWKVGFGKLNSAGDKFLLAYEVRVNYNEKKVKIIKHSPVFETTGFYYAAAKAYKAAVEKFKPQTESVNYAFLPKDENSVYVYFYPAQEDTKSYLLGGDARYTYDINGQKITEEMPLHKSILKMPMDLPKELEGRDASTITSAIVTKSFVETDVMYVLYRRFKAFHYVGTGNFIYKLNEDGDFIEKIVAEK